MFATSRRFVSLFRLPAGRRRLLAVLLVTGLFAQWAIGLAIRCETEAERVDQCRPAASWTISSLPECRVSAPPERESFLTASLFYHAAVIPAAPAAIADMRGLIFPLPPRRFTSAAPALLRRPPR